MKKKNEKAVAPSSLWRDAAKRFCKNKTAVVALVILCIMIIAAIFAGVLTPYGPYESDLANVKATPSSAAMKTAGIFSRAFSTARAFPFPWA